MGDRALRSGHGEVLAVTRYDAVVVGSGPNGLSAAITLAEAGRSVVVLEAAETIGGGTRSAELTLPGFIHDVCSSIHPLLAVSPAWKSVPWGDLGVELVQPEIPLGHPLDGGRAALLHRSIDETAAGLGPDGDAYRSLFAPMERVATDLFAALLAPLFPPVRSPRHVLLLARFGLTGIRSVQGMATGRFRGENARALLAGLGAHSLLRLDAPGTAGFASVLALSGHHAGWPAVRGGSQRIADALTTRLRDLGGEIQVARPVRGMRDLPSSAAVLFDTGPHQLAAIAGDALPGPYRSRLLRYRYGPGVFKIDYALDGPIPWSNPDLHRTATVHVGGTLDEIAASEDASWSGRAPVRPFILVAQTSLIDPSRAPAGKHTAWMYSHVPSGCTLDMTDTIERQIERFAPGFRDLVLARHTRNAIDYQRYNPNYVGGDINGGVQDLLQLYTRPVARIVPYSTPNPRLFLCSSSTPPGGGVHGLCGYFGAQAALHSVLR